MTLLLFTLYVDLQLWLVVILLSRCALSLTHGVFGWDVGLFADLLQKLTRILFDASFIFLEFRYRVILAILELEHLILHLLVPSIQLLFNLRLHILNVLVQLLYFGLDLDVGFWVEGGLLCFQCQRFRLFFMSLLIWLIKDADTLDWLLFFFLILFY